MATTTTTSGGTVTSFSNTPQAQDDIFTTGVIGTSSVTITEDLQGVVYLDVMSNDLGGNAKTLWSVDNATSLSTATKVYAPADLLVQDTSRIEATSTDTSLNGAKIWITSDGKVGYDAATLSTAFKAQLQELAAGASLADSFTYAIRLGNGTLSWATAQVQFAGMNDSVTMNIGVQAGTVTEDAPTTPSTTDSLSTTGTIAFSDVDLSDTHTASFVAAGGNTTALGNFALASVMEAANAANGTVNWTYTVNNAAAQYLAQGQTATETYVVTVSDGHGSSTTQNVIITITGTNDQVHITSGVQTGDAKEDSGDYAANGNITFTDADLIDTHSVTVTPGASGYLGSFTTDPLHDSTGTGSGSLGWHFAVDNAAVQFLGEGQTLTQTYNVAIGDGTVQTVTITITGTNDRPTLTIADTTGAMSEGNGAATLSDSGALSFADVDNIDVVTVSHTSNGNIAWSGGTLNAGVASALVAGFSVDHNSWDYSTSQNLDFLGAGETITFSYTVVATDNSGAANAASATQTVTITITGSNDAPVLSFASGNDAGAVKEDTTLSVSGQFSSTDIDHAATATWSIAGSNTGTYGSIAVDGSGKWTYTLANGTDGVASAVQSLKVGESHNEVFSVQVSDGLGGVATHLVTVTVTGSNDAPVLNFASGNDAGAVQEDSTLSVSGQFNSTDIDHAATATWSIAGSNTGTYGSIAVDGTGKWTYTLANGTDGVASAVQSLKVGESHNEVFSVQVSDGLGGVATHLVTVTVTGSNDAPVLNFASGNDAGAVQEDSTLSVSGQFSSTDIDHNATATWSIAGSNTGTYGSIAVDSTGQWTYTLANGTDGVASAVQSLKAGESHNEVFSVQVSDGLGGVATHLVTVTVTGSNDAPVLSFASGNDVGTVQEDTTLSVSGQFSSSDIDHAATATWSINGSATGTYGSIAVDSSGQWTYTLANGSDGVASAVQSLQAGESHDEVFTIQVSDGLGGVDTQQVTVTVTGSNDAPVLSFASGNDAGNVQEDTTLGVSGQFSSSDIDHNATATWSIAGSNTGTYGSIAVDITGQWTYTLANGTNGVASAVQSLQAGESHNEVFTIQVSDGLGGVDTQQVTVTVTGSNDAPVLSFASGNDAGNVQEDTTLSVSGQFSSTDIDHNATATWSIAGSNTGTYGSIAVDSSGQWTYTLANGTDGVASAVQSLQAGETHNEVFTIQVSDGLGGVDTQQVTVTVTGSNDAPVLSFASGNELGAVQEDTTLSVSGQFNSSDIDHNATATWSINGSATGTYGSIAVDSSGQWTYTLANGTDGVASAVQSLQAGETHNEVFTIQVSDGLGGVDTQQVTVTVTGSNDAPVLSFASGNELGAVQEDTTLSVSGQFNSSDIDHNATATWSINGSATGTYGSIAVDSSGQWTYTLANGTDGVASAVQSLQAGESHNEVFSVQVSDGLGGVATHLVTVTVTGSNDAPVLSFASGNDVGTVQEDTTLSVSGQFSSSDIDHAATATWSINGSATGTYGSIAVDSTGQWTYTLANGTNGVASAVQSLQAGESHDEVFTIQVSDGLGGVDTQQVTVTVTGSNDAPVLSFASGNDAGNVQEDTTLSVSGQFSSSDIDHNATATWSINGSATGTYGSIAVDSSGQWTYTLANGTNGVASAVQSLQAGETHNEVFTIQVSDGLGGVDTQQVTVTVTGSNDAPVLSFASGNDAGAVQEDSTLSVSGQFSSTDIDHAATATWSINGSATGTYGSIAVDSSGQWTYTLTNGTNGVASAVQSLQAGESHNEVFSVQVSDGLGGVDIQQVTVTVTGSNDAPVLSFASGNDAGTVQEDTTLSVSGQFSSTDIDHAATATWSIAGSNTGTYGSIAVDGSGKWTYTLANGTDGVASAVQSLQAGESHNEVFSVQVSDGLGGVDTQQVTVTVSGSNDAPVLSFASGNDAGNVQEDTTLSVSGQFSSNDIDHAATATWSINGSATGTYGSIAVDSTGQWTYTLANGTDGVASAVQSLKVGESHNEVFSVQVSDGLGGVDTQLVTITVTGSNDAPVLSFASGNDVGAVQEDTTLSVSGQFSSSDIDHAATATWSINGSATGTYGSIAVDSSGQWTYTLANGSDGVASAVQSLQAGESHDEVFTIQVSDGLGGVDTQQVTVTVTGSNDAPVLSFASGNDAGNVQEDTTLGVSGQFSSSDIDHNATATWSIAGSNTGTYGSIAVDITGQWTYTLANGTNGVASAVQSLQAGESHNEVFTIQVSDGLGGVDTQQVTVTVTGSNDAPVLSFASGNDAGNVQEDTTLSVSGQFSSTDIDHNATATWSIAGSNTGTYGSIAVDSSGQWTYTLANGTDGVASAVQSLQAGESHNEVFTIQVSDGLGGVDTQQVTVTVTGSNDAPVLSFASGNDVGTVQEDSTLSVSGQFSSSDIDHNATATWSIAGSNTGTYGSIAVDSSGQWTYTLANGTDGVASAVQSLKAGETHNEVFTIQVSDGLGGVDTQQVTVTVTGSNDAPVLSFASGNDAGAVKEDTTLSVSGQFSSADIDHAATATWSIAGSNTGTYGSIAVDGSGQWTYTLANGTNGVASAVQSLQAGESHNEVFSVQVSDGLGGVDTQQVTVTVTGSNDAPVLSFASGNDAGAVKEDTTLSVSGQFSSADIDHAATATWSIAGSNTGTYGSIAVDGSGQWTYTLANGTDGVASAVQSLKAGETHNEVFTIQVSDGLGGVDTQQVTVTVTGSNDAPVLSFASGNDAGAVQEDSTLSVSGQFSSADIDHAATATWSIAGSNTGTYGSIAVDGSGQWTYTLANGTDGVASAVQSLQAGESHNEVFSVQVSDGLGGVATQQVTVTVTGSNDAPVLSFASGNELGAVQEDTSLSVSGQFSSSDIDHDATATWSINGSATGTYGSIAVDSTGQWTYTLANGTNGVASAVQSLQAGETHNEVFSVQVSDGLGGVDTQQVTVTVTGSNDAAVLSSANVTLTETNAPLTTGGSLTVSDIDSPESFHTQTNTAGSYGQFSIATDGAWTYVANSAHNEFAAGTTYTDTFAVSSADGTLTSVTVHILGTNDAAVLSAGTANLTETNAAVDISTAGTLTISDVDSAATFVAQTNTAGSYGQFSIGTGGAWTYVANSAHNEFAAGTTYTDTFAVSSADGTLTSVTVHILGTNDAAVLSAGTANLTETNAAVDISTTGTLTISDVDSAATFVAQTNTAGSYGQFSIGTGGAWTYVANSAHNEFAAGTTYTDTFAVSSADGTLTSVTVHIAGSNDSPTITSNGGGATASINVVENTTAVTTVTATDVDLPAQTLTYSIVGGADAAKFSIASGTGALSFISAPNFEAPTDSGTNNVYDVIVRASDGTLFDDQAIAVTVTGVNDNSPVITSNGGGATASVNVAENTTAVTTVAATDADLPAQTLTYSIVGGADAAKFSIASGTGALSFISAPNFEAPTDSGTNNVYDVIVRASDGTLFDDQAIAVTVTGVNDNSPVITSNGGGATASVNVAENTTAVTTVAATDADLPAQTLTYSIVGGVDAAKFSIASGTGALSFISAPNFEAPTDSGTNNVYDVIVRASDGTLFDDQAIAVTVTGVNDNSPVITSNGGGATASVSVAENTTAVTTVAATDADLPAQTLTYSIVGGADAAKFSIASGTGALSFISAPNFEAPTDSGTNNVYDVIVRASDGTLFDDQAIAVTVTGVNDNSPIITSNGGGATASVSVAENTTAVTTVVATDADLPAQTLSYSILNTAGTDFSKFSISSSGVLTFNSAPDYENPQDVGGTAGDNAYVVDVQVADGNGGVDTQTITVNVQNVVETPVDTVPPTVAVTGTALGSSVGSTSTVTFQFSETVSGFSLADVSVTTTSGTPRGTFSNFTQVDGDTFTATLTRTQGGSIKVDVAANSYTDLAGNPGAAGSSANLPAGVAGEPINLALYAPLADISGPVTVAISGVPSGWVFNAGTDNGDGTWTVQTSDPGALTVTPPSDFVGALVLDVNMSWSNSDGSTASAYVFNNVEVYAPGAPIFALSANDNLTGSSGADTFVFAQPIGNNQIFNFDAAADKIDLVGFTGINGFADLSITNDANGNALVSISSGQTVTLKGVDAADLSEANFQFDVDPLTNNAGTLTIADGAIMPFGGSIHNSGTIELGSAGSATSLEVLFRGATLTGGGQVLLSDNAQNVIFGGSADTVLNNVDNRISGAGQLGAGQMVLINSGLIMASGLNSLVLDTGTHTITNSGVLESTGPGGMTVASTVENTGHLWANGGDLRLLADVTGDGSATIDGNATLTFSGAAHGSVAFHGEGAGTLVIAQAETAGSLAGILGLESNDMLTFGNLTFGANTQLSYNTNASGAGGLLTVDDGVHRAEVNLLGHYSAEDFQVTDGGAAGTQVSYHGESSGTLVGTMLADTISGGDGNDIIVGRGGADTLSGGAGADVFAYFNVNEGGDHILDYNYAEGDKIDLSALLKANFVAGTSQVSDFVQVVQTGNDITVKVDPDGASNGKNFVDVAVLDHTGTPGPDLVRTWFGDSEHTLTA
ncbi:VCBS domain-containing protein [Pseudomonas sp. B21-019]|uniref:beta strand repeat-containing protein n=10 Tax=unclassified Pseudomonas TaxID=196821 RepID=UPI00215E472C|nr:VCBS domain-containing protein [Pseudomonas sp. B21-019]UVM34409.1 VCBS domain-containing protein [Pseudomonas sp. B21-019]